MIYLLIIAKSVDGGTGTFLLNFSKLKTLIKAIKIKTIVFEEPNYRNLNQNKLDCIYVHKKNFYPGDYSLLNSLKYFLWDIYFIKRTITTEKPNIVISINNYANIILSFCNLLSKNGPKTILTHHNNLSQVIDKRCSPLVRFILRIFLFIIFKKSYHIAVSKGVADDIKNLSKQKNIKVIPYGFNFKKVNRIKSLSKRKKILSIGRFDKQKDFMNIITAFSYVIKKYKKCNLTLIGDGQDHYKLLNYVNKLNLTKFIKIIGWKSNINEYLRMFDLFIFSSLYEGLPNVIIEAMSHGLPVISTDTPFGPREILDNGTYGILVPMKDPEAMARAIYELLTDEKKYDHYSQKSLERAKYFSLEKMLNSYQKIIIEIAKKKSISQM